MKSLTKRGEGEEDELDAETLPNHEPGILPDYDQPPRFSANQNLIEQTIQLVSQEYKDVRTIS